MLGAYIYYHPLRRSKAAVGLSLLVACFAVSASAPALAATPRYAAMVIDANTGAVLHNQAGDERRYPASLTKMMTLYMTFELIELGRLGYASTVKMTEAGAAAAPSKLDIAAGTEIAVLDAIKALITKSANDVAIALAQHIAGSEENFARLMTRKAREIGMAGTTFKNASGLPDPGQVTTARDMLTLALRLRDDFPHHYRLFSTRTFTYGGETFRNHNSLLTRYRGTDGLKTGYTRLSGFNLVASVGRDGKRVVGAIFGGRSARARDSTMQSLLTKSLAKASTTVTRKPAVVARAPQPVRAMPPAQPLASAAPPRQPPPPPANANAGTSHAITVAKVRRVLIGPDLQRRPAPGNSPTEPRPVFAVADAAASAPPPGPLETGRDDELPRFAPAADVLRTESAPTAPAGQPPSTLQAQADALGGQAPKPAPPITRPMTTGATAAPKAREASRAARGGFEIQIGAFGDSAEAERSMASARQRAGTLLDNHAAVAVPAQKGTGQIYRARFKGFDAIAAASACGELKRLQIDCFVIKTE